MHSCTLSSTVMALPECACLLPDCMKCAGAGSMPQRRVIPAGRIPSRDAGNAWVTPGGRTPSHDARSVCACLLPGCQVCAASTGQSSGRLTRKGKNLSRELLTLVHTVDCQLSKLLRSGKYLTKGPDYGNISRDFKTSKTKGTRHDWLVSHICQVGVRSVQTSRVSKFRRSGVQPLTRGPKNQGGARRINQSPAAARAP